MEPGKEVIFLRTRYGFVKMAMQTGAHLVPAFAFGQSRMCAAPCRGLTHVPCKCASAARVTRARVHRRSFGYARPGPPLLPAATPRVLAKARRTRCFPAPRCTAADNASVRACGAPATPVQLLGFAPMAFWGRWGTPVPYAVPVHVVVGKPIRVQQGALRGATLWLRI
jgi:hypothetical protein